jgi:hypothetical protein
VGIQDRLAERKLNDSMQFAAQAGGKLIAELTRVAGERDYVWKQRLDELVKLEMRKYEGRLGHLQACETLVRSLRVFDECKRL